MVVVDAVATCRAAVGSCLWVVAAEAEVDLAEAPDHGVVADSPEVGDLVIVGKRTCSQI